jgi:hypothetical protein
MTGRDALPRRGYLYHLLYFELILSELAIR